jgi:hypothetical protein
MRNFSYDAGSPDEWVRAARAHTHELTRIVQAQLERHERKSF